MFVLNNLDLNQRHRQVLTREGEEQGQCISWWMAASQEKAKTEKLMPASSSLPALRHLNVFLPDSSSSYHHHLLESAVKHFRKGSLLEKGPSEHTAAPSNTSVQPLGWETVDWVPVGT